MRFGNDGKPTKEVVRRAYEGYWPDILVRSLGATVLVGLSTDSEVMTYAPNS